MKPALLTAPILLALAACTPSGGDTAATAEPAAEAAAPAPAETAAPEISAASFDAVIAGGWRTPEFVERDRHRHPAETLEFFGLQPGHTVVEITPGGGWYAEILAPYVREQGQYVAAVVDPEAVAEDRRDYYA